MSTAQLKSVNDLANFLSGSQKAAFAVLGNKREKYRWIQSVLVEFKYFSLSRRHKGIVIKYIQKISGYSRQQLTKLICQYKKTKNIIHNPRTVNGFKVKYTKENILALAAMDEAHGTLNGIATKKLCERAWLIYHDEAYKNLSGISVRHLYNLRTSTAYKNKRVISDKTKPVKSTIGSRRKPITNGMPGFLRLDSVHQGDHDGKKGVYHINAVDEVTQFEIVCTVERITKEHLLPIIEYILQAFPFKILGFHTDNGSEYINHSIAKLLNELLIDFTKSRARKSSDNGLAETKNGCIIRKIYGHSHIPQKFAQEINILNQEYLNDYINYHRPCLFASSTIDLKGKEIKKYEYKNVFTPYEKLKSLKNSEQHLKPGITFNDLDQKANMMSDAQAAERMNAALKKLFHEIVNDKEKDAYMSSNSA